MNSRSFSMLVVITAFSMAVFSGCTKIDNPSTPDFRSERILSESGNQRILWGVYEIGFDMQSMTAEVVPLRGVQFNANVTRFIGGTAITSQPSAASVGNELEALITNNAGGRNPGLATACGGACSDARTLEIATAACAGALGSTAITAQ